MRPTKIDRVESRKIKTLKFIEIVSIFNRSLFKNTINCLRFYVNKLNKLNKHDSTQDLEQFSIKICLNSCSIVVRDFLVHFVT